MKCRRCREPAVIEVRRHNAGFCQECFLHHCREQVRRTIEDFKMVAPGQRVLVAVSGGKDSLALWDILGDLDFATSRGLTLKEIDLPTDLGFDIPSGAKRARRVPCSACGLSKRHLFNQAALDGGFDVVATGHNLDDEAAVLFGNVLRWSEEYLARQLPVLPAAEGFARKVKPLVRLGERETAAYCVLRGIDYIVEECPMAAGNKHLGYKEALNLVEDASPGTKHAFYFGFLDKARNRFVAQTPDEETDLRSCARCSAPTTTEVCAFCRLVERASAT
jgi:uncharacterized protein (TIGR00269 family)